MTIQLKRGTRARVNLTASQRGFLTGEPLLITDENRLAVATSPSTYTTFLKEGEGGGNVLATSGAIGYGAGAGGTVVQATSKSTPVTLNKPSGKITMNNAALAAGASVVFVVNNTFAQNNDLVVAHTDSTGGFTLDVYRVEARASVNAFAIKVTNTSGASLSEAVVINFAIIKGSAS